MDVCIITNDALLARFAVLELAEAGYEATAGEAPTDAALYIYDLDFSDEMHTDAIGFSYDEAKQAQVKDFLRRPLDAEKLRNTVAKYFSKIQNVKNVTVEVDRATRKAKSELGEVRLSEKELALLEVLCRTQLLTREDGAKVFGDTDSNVVDVYMHYLRKKLAHVYDGETICSKRNKGYFISSEINIKFI